MSRLWREKKDYVRIEADTPMNQTIQTYCPYKRLYRNLTQEELKELIRDAEQYHWQALDLSYTGITSLPDAVWNLTNLLVLDLGGTGITSLPDAVGNLTNLQSLYLNNTGIMSLPDAVLNLTNLQWLDLEMTGISSLPDAVGNLTNLQSLYLSGTGTTSLPNAVLNLTNLQWLYLYGTPLDEKLPPEIRQQPAQDVIRYILQMQSETTKKRYFNESKMVVVGQGAVGKSCVVNRLIHNKFEDQHSTEGIAIEHWLFLGDDRELYTLNVWDFGGQEIYHSTHQFFLTERTLYLFVWDVLTEDEYGRMDYWLRTIQSLAGDSPILIVVNKCDKDLGRHRYVENAVQERYPQIRGIFYISCRDGIQIPELRDAVLKEAQALPLMKTLWLDKWLSVREQLEKLAAERKLNFITYKQYENLCRAEGIDEADALSLIQYLHDLGIVLYYRNDPLLKNLVILSPEWGTGAVYKVLDEQERTLKDRNGILYYEDLPKIWIDRNLYPPEMYPYLLNLMENFQIAFRIDREGTESSYLVAELLNVNPVKGEWPSGGGEPLAFRYAYDFLPAGVMTRLIVYLHEYLEDVDGVKQCWRKGAFLCLRSARAKLELYDGIDRKYLDVRVIGDSARDRRDLLSVVRRGVEEINRRYEKIEITELVPCRCSPGCKYFFEYETLRRAEEIGVSVQCQKSLVMLPTDTLLDGVELMERDDEEDSFHRIIRWNRGDIHAGDIEKSTVVNVAQNLDPSLEKETAPESMANNTLGQRWNKFRNFLLILAALYVLGIFLTGKWNPLDMLNIFLGLN